MGQEWGGGVGASALIWAVPGPAVGTGPASLFTLSKRVHPE